MHEAATHSLDLAWLIPAFPLAGFLILYLGRDLMNEPGTGCVATMMFSA